METTKHILTASILAVAVLTTPFHRASACTRAVYFGKDGQTITAISLALFAAIASPARAQEILPRPEQPFGGKIGRITKDSVKDFPKVVEAPKGAPNVLVILTDDVGFGASSTFGGEL